MQSTTTNGSWTRRLAVMSRTLELLSSKADGINPWMQKVAQGALAAKAARSLSWTSKVASQRAAVRPQLLQVARQETAGGKMLGRRLFADHSEASLHELLERKEAALRLRLCICLRVAGGLPLAAVRLLERC
mmetsp:Transcript_60038/g.134999  ORF Transcript_60038/g.134999 Transcript_60038/m.134999 type:complete len:132 (-) Transcript_60038:23-418(-)